MTSIDTLLSYYRSIAAPGRPLAYCWPDLEALGLGDPAEVCRLNAQLVANHQLREVSPKNRMFGTTTIYLIT